MNSIKRYLNRTFRAMLDRPDLPYGRAPVALATCDTQQGRLELCNLAFAELMGYATIEHCISQFSLTDHLAPCIHNEVTLANLRALHALAGQQLLIKSSNLETLTVNCNLAYDPVSGNMEMALMGQVPGPESTDALVAKLSEDLQQLQFELDRCRQWLDFALQATDSTLWEWDLTRNRVSHAGAPKEGQESRISQSSMPGDFYVDGVKTEDLNSVNQAMQACLGGETGGYAAEFRQADSQGEEHWIRGHGKICLRDPQGKPRQLMGLHTDVTELKHANQYVVELQAQLFQARKMHAVGQLTGGFAHDFNNILASIIGYSNLLLEKGRNSLDPSYKDYLKEVCKAGQLGQAMVAQMLRFARNDSTAMAPAMISLLVRDAVQLIRPSMPSSIELQVVIDDHLPSVKTNGFKLTQMLTNLCANAKDAMDGNGTLLIQLGLEDIHKLSCSACGDQVTGQFAQLMVGDSGTGINERMLPMIFADFFTTKRPGEGTGMGLAIVNNLIHEHGGHIHVASEAGQGTRFKLLFPTTREIASNQTVLQLGASRFQPSKRGHILVVDDDRAVGKYLAEVIRLHGHRVTFESDSLLALELLQEKPNRFDVIVTDQIMPGITGAGLMYEVRRIRKGLPVIICSGDYQQMSEAAALQAGAQGYLDKPINVDKLLELIDLSLRAEQGS